MTDSSSSNPVERAVDLVRDLIKYPSLQYAQITGYEDSLISIDSVWTQKCIEENASRQFSKSYLIGSPNLNIISKSKPSCIGDSVLEVPSPSGAKTAIVRKHKPDSKATDDKYFIEIWSRDGCCEKVVDVSTCDKHGAVYGADGVFGALSWKTSEDQLAYIAEKNQPKASSYFSESKKEADEKKKPVPGDQHVYKQDWGERLVDKIQPVVCTLDITSGQVTVIEDEILADSSCGHVAWRPNSTELAFCVLPHHANKLGLIACPMRESVIYRYDLDTSTLTPITDSTKLSQRSPRFSPDGSKMVYMECTVGGPHHKCSQLKMIDLVSNSTSVVIDVVNKPGAEVPFQGLYGAFLPVRCWHDNNKHIFFPSLSRSRKDVFAVNVASGEVHLLTKEAGTWIVEDVNGGYLLLSYCSPNVPFRLAIASVKDFDINKEVSFTILDENTVNTDIMWEVRQHTPTTSHPVYGIQTYESIVVMPANQKSSALLVYPHGGPHSMHVPRYSLLVHLLVKFGYTVALVNFRGSLGFGEDFINSLPGHVGDYDIKDVQQCAEEVMALHQLDKEKVVAYGASHGGFITAHLIGQYPKFYKAAVIDCGVTNITSMASITDIPDWCHVEAGIQPYLIGEVPSAEKYSRMYGMSPVAHLENVCAPTLVLVGGADKRVPPSQGVEYHKALKARGVTTKMYVFPESNHSTDTVEVLANRLVNIYSWFNTHLQ